MGAVGTFQPAPVKLGSPNQGECQGCSGRSAVWVVGMLPRDCGHAGHRPPLCCRGSCSLHRFGLGSEETLPFVTAVAAVQVPCRAGSEPACELLGCPPGFLLGWVLWQSQERGWWGRWARRAGMPSFGCVGGFPEPIGQKLLRVLSGGTACDFQIALS